MPDFTDIRGFLAEEIGNLHERLDQVHQRFHTLCDEWVQEASSQFSAGNNPVLGTAQHNAPGGYVPEAPTSAPEGSSSTQSSSGSSQSSPSSSSSSSSSDGKATTTTETKSSDTGSSGTSQPK